MTPRWRVTLRLRALMLVLIDRHLPLGSLTEIIGRIESYSDSGLVDGFVRRIDGVLAPLAIELADAIIGEEPFESRDDSTLIHAVDAALRGALARLQPDPKAAACVESIEAALQRLDAAARAADARPPGEPRDLLRVLDEVNRRRGDAQRAFEQTLDQGHNAVVGVLDDLLAFMRPLRGAPLPELQTFDVFLASREFYDLMQAYRHTPVERIVEVTEAYEAVKAAIRKAARQ